MLIMKILVISNNPFSNTYNNGKTLESMFSWIPKSNLAQVFFHSGFDPDFSFCNKYYRVSDIDVCKSLWLRRECGNEILSSKSTDSNRFHFSLLARYFKLSSLQIVRDYIWNLVYTKIKRKPLYKWVKDFNPDIVFFVGGNCGFAHSLVWDIVSRQKCRLFSYFTDDYVIYPRYKNLLMRLQKKRLQKIYATTIKMSEKCFVIGREMSKEYNKKYFKEFIPIMNSVEIDDYPLPAEKSDNIIITYLGNLGIDRWKMICRFADFLFKIQQEFGLKTEFRVFSGTNLNSTMRHNFNKYKVKYMGYLAKDKLKNAIIQSDILLHVESDKIEYRTFTRLSISTKIPEYLVSKRAVIGFGPSEVASISLIKENYIGFVIDSNVSYEMVKNKIYTILRDYEMRNRIAEQALDFAKLNFEIHKNQSILKKYFVNV